MQKVHIFDRPASAGRVSIDAISLSREEAPASGPSPAITFNKLIKVIIAALTTFPTASGASGR